MLMEEQFMQFPKWLMNDERFSDISNDAKILYTLLKDRHRLSLKNHWIDSDGNVFLICRRQTMEQLLHKSNKTTLKIFQELLDCGLVSEKKNGKNKPNYIYLHIPETITYKEDEYEEDNYIPEEYVEPSEVSNNSTQKTPENDSINGTCNLYTSRNHVKITQHDMKNLHVHYSNTSNINNTNSKNNKSNNEFIINDDYSKCLNYSEDTKNEPVVAKKQRNSYFDHSSFNNDFLAGKDPLTVQVSKSYPAIISQAEKLDEVLDKTNTLYSNHAILDEYLRNCEGFRSTINAIKAYKLFDSVIKSFTKINDRIKISNMNEEDIASFYAKALSVLDKEGEIYDKKAYLAQVIRAKLKSA